MNISKQINYSAIIILISLLCFVVVFVFIPPIHQWPNYHLFADTQKFFGIPNFLNVISNLLFSLVSLLGFISLYDKWQQKKLSFQEMIVFLFIFIGILLTGIGSDYYHLYPNNVTLVWDRLPMTMVFMSLISLTIMEKINSKLGFYLFLPLLLFGIASVLYWHWMDDLRWYGFVQFYSIFLILLILYCYPNTPPRLRIYIWMFIFYGMAKVFELFDASIYSLTGLISGHTLKHIAAAISAYCIVMILNDKH